MNKKIIGMRTIKTSLVVIIAYYVSSIIPNSLEFSLIYAAIIAIDTSVTSSVKVGLYRVLGTIIGSVIGLVFSYLPIYKGIAMSLGVIVVILITNYLDTKKATGIGIVLVIIILLGSEEYTPLLYSIQRTIDTLLGVLIATVVNIVIFPPDQMMNVRNSFEDFKAIAKDVIPSVILFKSNEGIDVMNKTLGVFSSQMDTLEGEMSILRKSENEEYLYYKKLLEESEKINIYLETLSLTDESVEITKDNSSKLSKYFKMDIYKEKYISIETSTREELIYNYTLSKLLNSYEKVNAAARFPKE
ncbi:MAG: hypothetical protein GX752_01230 [Clostridium sp.]|nr:hypothetical protein [Clostridium sp.]